MASSNERPRLIKATIDNQRQEFDDGLSILDASRALGIEIPRATDLLDISVEDANRLKLRNTERVRVHSAYGKAVLPIRITSSVKPGELFATFHTAEVFLNHVTSPHRDRYVKTPDTKLLLCESKSRLKKA